MDKALEIAQNRELYRYNSDTLFLYGFAKNFLKNNINVLDIGAGSGILGLMCARDFKIRLTLNERNPTMAKLCSFNAFKNASCAEILVCDILEANLKNIDFIISNPPFYRKDVTNPQNENLYLAKKSENLPLDLLCAWAKNALSKNGKFVFCYDAKEINHVFSALRAAKLNVEALRFVHPRENKNASLAMFMCADSKSQTKILPPLYNFIGERHSSEALEIFETCKVRSVEVELSEIIC